MNKRYLSGILAAALLLGCGTQEQSAANETAQSDTTAESTWAPDNNFFPEVRQVVNGFEALEIRDFSQINASVVRFVHQKTGAELYYIANDDTDRVFDLTFRTESPDDTGIPHVFEHAILNGSEKYPSRQLYDNLEYQTYNTFIRQAE